MLRDFDDFKSLIEVLDVIVSFCYYCNPFFGFFDFEGFYCPVFSLIIALGLFYGPLKPTFFEGFFFYD